jgi:hypothetical protein
MASDHLLANAMQLHAWVPDAYEGAPTPVTGWMAAATKLAAFGATPAAAQQSPDFGTLLIQVRPPNAEILIDGVQLGGLSRLQTIDVVADPGG